MASSSAMFGRNTRRTVQQPQPEQPDDANPNTAESTMKMGTVGTVPLPALGSPPFSVWTEFTVPFTVPTGKRGGRSREECHWSRACKSFERNSVSHARATYHNVSSYVRSHSGGAAIASSASQHVRAQRYKPCTLTVRTGCCPPSVWLGGKA
jgi:hypothetical protein